MVGIGGLLIGGTLAIREIKTRIVSERWYQIFDKLFMDVGVYEQTYTQIESTFGKPDRRATSMEQTAHWIRRPIEVPATTALITSYELRCWEMPKGPLVKPCNPQGVFVFFNATDKVIRVEAWATSSPAPSYPY